jgi:hypothetical protein
MVKKAGSKMARNKDGKKSTTSGLLSFMSLVVSTLRWHCYLVEGKLKSGIRKTFLSTKQFPNNASTCS